MKVRCVGKDEYIYDSYVRNTKGNSGGGKKDGGKWKSDRALHRLQQQKQQQGQQLAFPPGFGGGFGNGRGNGHPNDVLPLTCFNCGLPGHVFAICPKTKK